MDRRRFVASAGTAGVAAVAGCLGGGGGHVRPDGDPETVPAALSCDDETFERHYRNYEESDVRWGDGERFSLRVDGRAFERGETVGISLRNASLWFEETGNRDKYYLELRTDAGWEEVRGWADGTPRPYNDDAVTHRPGAGFDWQIEMTADGVLDATTYGDRLRVCPALEAGRYRFVY